MMEYSTIGTERPLIEELYNLQGVVRVDTHTCTPSLGKWHITVDQTHYSRLCERIDTILTTTFENFQTK